MSDGAPFIPIRTRTAAEIVKETRRCARATAKELSEALKTKQLDADVELLHAYMLGTAPPSADPAEAIDRLLRYVNVSMIAAPDAIVPPTVPEEPLLVCELIRAAIGRLKAQNGEPVTQRYAGAILGWHESTISRACKTGTLPRTASGIDPRAVRMLLERMEGDEDPTAETVSLDGGKSS